MFGQNEVLKQDLSDNLWVQEVFATIQGEGPYAGRPAIFVRLAGCNLRCYACDTDFESSNQVMTIEELFYQINTIHAYIPATLIVITGGEPLRQNILPLVHRLFLVGFTVQIETAGTLWVPNLNMGEAEFVVSPKTGKVNPEVEARAVAYKYVIRMGELNKEDGLPEYSTQVKGKPQVIARPPKWLPIHRIYVQPWDDYDEVQNQLNIQAAVNVAMKYGYTLSLQTHKYLELP